MSTLTNTSNHLVSGLGGTAGFGENFLDRNDDEFTGFIDLTSVFSSGINFFGQTYTGVYLNNNGNLTFNSGLGTYTPYSLTGTSTPMIAAYFADVDTRNSTDFTGGSNLAWYDLDTVNHIFTATWDHVGYYDERNDKSNSFQIQLIENGANPIDIVFRYENIDWTTGEASGGVNGFGGVVATAGFNNGAGAAFQLTQSFNQHDMLVLDSTLGNTGYTGVWQFSADAGNIGTTGNDIIVGGVTEGGIFIGSAGDDNITGTPFDDFISDGLGADTLIGLGGNDTYALTDNDNTIIETPDGGTDDTVQVGFTIDLGLVGSRMVGSVSMDYGFENIENIVLTGSANINATGNNLDNEITGNSGNNILDGGAGADTLAGGLGNDTYIIDRYDRVVENATGGNDTVVTDAGVFSLTGRQGQNLENLTLTSSSRGHVDGNNQGNIINGGSSRDELNGGDGNDTLNGNGGDDRLDGEKGNDTLNGGAGRDLLTGGRGADSFVFDLSGVANADKVKSFNAGQGDKVVLDNAFFTSLAGPAVAASELIFGSASADANDFLIFEKIGNEDGKLYYDADGNGAAVQQLIATFTGAVVLAAGDFSII